MTSNPQDELLDRARRIIRDLRERLAAAEAQRRPDPIAIVGMGFRFPGAGSDPERFWQMIAEGRDAVTPVPPDRWDAGGFFAAEAAVPGKINTRHGSFLEDVRRFDAAFFDITPREAVRMDPQQRLFLETAWHALEDAGLPRTQIAGTETGVFVGVHGHSSDYQAIQFRNLDTLDAYSATGTAHDMIAGRLAYWLDLHGPAIAVDTACSSSLAAVHLACRSLRAGDCSLALAGGVNLLLEPGFSVAAAQLQLLSPDGHCRTFDSRASGMGRGEGCGVVVLKRLSAAQRDGDRVLAVIRGSAMNQDGRTNGLTAPSGLAQQQVLRKALEDASVQPTEIGYIEAHGTGTALGDPIEVEALAAVLGSSQRSSPCRLGAIKANLGHLEGAAGIAGLIKTVMVLRRRWLPPVANLAMLNPHLAFEGTGLEIPQRGQAWQEDARRLAGVSSFGWSGTNVHVVLEEAPAESAAAAGLGPWPVLVSAQTPKALRLLATEYARRLEAAAPAELAAISFTSALRRTHHPYRIGVSGMNPEPMAAALRRRADALNSPKPLDGVPSDSLLARWESGAEVDWRTLFPRGGTVVDLPRYPFQGKEYWLDEVPGVNVSRTAEGLAHSEPAKTAEEPLPTGWVYSLDWIERSFDETQQRSDLPAVWHLLGAECELKAQVAESLRQRRGAVVRSRPESHVAGQSDSADALAAWLAPAAGDRTNSQYILYFAGEQDAASLTAEALSLTQSLVRSGTQARLSFITQGAEQFGPVPTLPHAAHAALRGFSRSFGLEHPDLAGALIDADPASASAVCNEVASFSGEDRVLLRAGRRWLARLQRLPDHPTARRPLQPNRSYLVTGAFGALGMEIAAWLIASGARSLVLAGRRAPAHMGKPELLRRLETWRAQGIDIQAHACDVSDPVQVENLLESIDRAGKPLAGVIHAAALISYSPVEQDTDQDVYRAFLPKLEGARVLDRCTRSRPLDFFVLFSSAAATIGLRNGTVYAAANSALDAVAAERQRAGLPGLCVEWGSWLYAEASVQRELVTGSGLVTMRPASALRVLGSMLDKGIGSALVGDIDWSVLAAALEMRGRQALAADVAQKADPPALRDENGSSAAWISTLAELPPSQRQTRLLDFVAAEAKKIFGMAPTDLLDESRGLFQLGMDSLMGVRLRRRLEAGTGLRLPGTITLTCPNLTALAAYIDDRLFPPAADNTFTDPTPVADDRERAFLAAMDDAETSAALAAELAVVQQKLGSF